MYSVANHTGLLLEIRIASPFSMEDAMAVFKQIYRAMSKERGKSKVIADLRGLRVVDPAIIDLVTGMMKQDNPFVERNAFLLPDSGALLAIQTERLIKQVGSEARRNFRERHEAEHWLGEVLTAPEQARLSAFLDEAFEDTAD
jgi:hypothetical protein